MLVHARATGPRAAALGAFGPSRSWPRPTTWAQPTATRRRRRRQRGRASPAKLATYTATVANRSAQAEVPRLLTDRSEGLGASKGGGPEDVRIIAVGPLPGRQGVWMLAAPPPLTSLLAMSSGDPSTLVIDGYITKQAARVRFIPVNFFVAVIPSRGSKGNSPA